MGEWPDSIGLAGQKLAVKRKDYVDRPINQLHNDPAGQLQLVIREGEWGRSG